ncbi:hypothetical protein GLAREA_10741 [Glarea lozoyensis ATCC 20868]|uniref:Uncharacterized protein n=1 Tax=Glarea lozoyensis (strain ATCC 20868 / MF5171) TaxID=1116229 RepID=S3DSU3_GLAL2|nr:uncharacterized protein GLAREA_10741 [Glarea lozoyensis ATCC 20868]EPE35046.1 hypothetical protein GLAREA_10741 [Glarea lozoyensis ATCC 20868]
MVLLTSSQVSVAISSFIVISFTLALFLSGYVLQQATVRDLRAAIKPQMVQPFSELQVNLSPQRQDEDLDRKAILETIPIEANNFREGAKDTQITQDSKHMSSGNEENQEDNEDDMVGATRWQKAQKKKQKLLAAQQKSQKQVIEDEPPLEATSKSSAARDTKLLREKNPEEKPLSKAQRRKKIKEEVIAAGQGETFTGYRRRMW